MGKSKNAQLKQKNARKHFAAIKEKRHNDQYTTKHQ